MEFSYRWIGIPLAVAVVFLTETSLGFAQTSDRSGFQDVLFGRTAEPQIDDATQEPVVTFRLIPANAQPGDEVTFAVSLTLRPDEYTYGVGGTFSGRTQIKVEAAPGLESLSSGFTPDSAPKTAFEPLFGQDVEKHREDVTWSKRYRIKADADVSQIAVSGSMRYQICNSRRCRPFSVPFDVALVEGAKTPEEPEIEVFPFNYEETPKYSKKPGPASIRILLEPDDAGPGDEVTLSIKCILDDGWHTYSTTQDPKQAARPTVIKTLALSGLTPLADDFEAERDFEIKQSQAGAKTYRQEVFHDEIEWTRRFRVEPSVEPGEYGLRGSIKYQVCKDDRCLRPKTVKFALGQIAAALAEGVDLPGPLNFAGGVAPAKPVQVTVEPTLSGGSIELVEISDTPSKGSLPLYLLYAFIGGLILNVMPCVLPVLAIKVMSFVQQAGESRARILTLNLAYTAGVVGVFLSLATLAVVLGYGWGELFQSANFNLIMACIVFAMGLSLLGVFEIPVPGMVGSAAGSQQKEGPLGAFLTGIFATLLATPCSGPFMGITLAWSVQQPAYMTFLIWGVMGLGMAAPYVIFGMIPGAVKLLPKPGMWMVRFKEFAGFVLMGTVVFFINFIDKSFTIPLLVMLLGISLGLWMIGSLYDVGSPIRHKNVVRVSALVLSGIVCSFGYYLTMPGVKLPWEPFSEQRFTELRTKGNNVLIDFTADWCLICKQNESFALNTPATLKLIEEYDVVPLYADYTNDSPEIERWLEKFDSISVPLTVIVPGADPNKAYVIRDAYTKGTLLEALQEAVDNQPRGEAQASRSQNGVN